MKGNCRAPSSSQGSTPQESQTAVQYLEQTEGLGHMMESIKHKGIHFSFLLYFQPLKYYNGEKE